MNLFDRVLERVSLLVLLIGGAGMLTAMFLGTADVVGTQFLGRPVAGALELTESVMVLIVFGALAYAQRRRSHIRVELLYGRFPPRVRAGLDGVAHLFAMVFFALLAWQAMLEAVFSWEIGEATVGLVRFPLYPARWILVAGVVLLLLQLVVDLVLDVRRVLGRAPLEPAPGAAAVPDIPELAPLGEDEKGRR